jgi:gliding motility-associated-like protein
MGAVFKPFLLIAALTSGFATGSVFQVRGFSFTGVSNRIITPNGDGRNDNVAFQFSNSRDAAGTIKIYDLRGHILTTLAINPGDTSEYWDARVAGALVTSGVYIYVINVDGVVVSGTVVVVR